MKTKSSKKIYMISKTKVMPTEYYKLSIKGRWADPTTNNKATYKVLVDEYLFGKILETVAVGEKHILYPSYIVRKKRKAKND